MSNKTGGRGQRPVFTDQEALLFHSQGRPGKLEVIATKPMATQRDLSLAYSPGVAVPVLAIADDPGKAYDYTTKGNFVAVITNGTAILGLGNRGALAAKPVMEGKAVLFKRFADIDSIDLEVSSEDPDEIVNCVRLLGKSWGGINLEDIRAPECFVIEQRLRELLDIPVFHDDQHGTAIIAAAGLINALELTGRSLRDVKLVVNGAGAAGIACTELVKAMGVRHDNVILCDTQGVIYRGRERPYGPQYLIPTPFDPRLIPAVPAAVAKAAIETGVARKPIVSLDKYRHELRSRLDPTASRMQLIMDRVHANPRRLVLAEG